MNIFVTGTDTGVGKTVVSATLALKLGFRYWKPLQTGALDGTDRQFVGSMIGPQNVDPEIYCYDLPASPHLAAFHVNEHIELERVLERVPQAKTVIEGAGGVLVPINDTVLMVDLIQSLSCPIVLVARSTLGTINHTLLSLESLRSRCDQPIVVVMVGEPNAANRRSIEKYGRVQVVGEIPFVDHLNTATVRKLGTLIQWKETQWNALPDSSLTL